MLARHTIERHLPIVQNHVNSEIRLGDFSTTPLYNIKAVVQATDISPSTLRAWERRYNVCRPERSESGYRLYSDQDVAIIRWLKMQVDSGMSISQAVSWYESMVEESEGLDDVTLPGLVESTPGVARGATAAEPVPQSGIRSLSVLQKELLDALLQYDEPAAERVMAEAFSLYTFERIGDELIAPVLVEVGERWHRGQLSITHEHYASNYLKQRLAAMLRALPNSVNGPLFWVGCAPSEQHEIGALLLSLYLRRGGYRVRYLGQNLPIDDFVAEVKEQRPDMVLFSATTLDAVYDLQMLTKELSRLNLPRLLIGYGGRIFNERPELREEITGIFLGASTQNAVEIIDELLQNK